MSLRAFVPSKIKTMKNLTKNIMTLGAWSLSWNQRILLWVSWAPFQVAKNWPWSWSRMSRFLWRPHLPSYLFALKMLSVFLDFSEDFSWFYFMEFVLDILMRIWSPYVLGLWLSLGKLIWVLQKLFIKTQEM